MFILLLQLQYHSNPDYYNMADGLRSIGHRVYLGHLDKDGYITWHNGRDYIDKLSTPLSVDIYRKKNISIHKLYCILRNMRELRSYIIMRKPDIVQIDFGSSILLRTFPIGLTRRSKFIQDVKQINLGVKSGIAGKLKDIKTIKAIQLCSRFIYDHTLFDYKLAGEAVLGKDWLRYSSVTPVGISSEFLTLSRFEILDRSPNSKVRFVFIGSLTRHRYLELLIDAIKITSQKTDCFIVDFIGPDKSNGYYKEMIKERGLDQFVRIIPEIPYCEVPAILQKKYDVGLAYNPDRLTWHYQPTIKILEYRAIGLPIISTDVRSHRDIVEDGVNGLIVANSPELWSAAMMKFITDYEFLRRCHKNASKMRQGRTIKEVADMHEKVYEKLLNK